MGIGFGGIKGVSGKSLTKILLFILLLMQCEACARYTAIELPKEFKAHQAGGQILNNKAQVIGHVGKMGEDQRAAYWSSKNGVVKIPLTGRSMAGAINDNGDIAASRDRAVLWKTGSNQLRFGPVGYPVAINDSGDILAGSKFNKLHGYSIWDTTDDTVSLFKTTSLPPKIATEWLPYFNHIPSSTNYNKKLNGVTIQGSDAYLVINGKNKLLIPKDGTVYIDPRTSNPDAFINNNDEVVAITYKPDPATEVDKRPSNIFSITKWNKNGTEISSEKLTAIPSLKEILEPYEQQANRDYEQQLANIRRSPRDQATKNKQEQNLVRQTSQPSISAKLKGFNDFGQILIEVFGKVFLLTPKK